MFVRKVIVLVFVFACAASCALAQDQDTGWSKLEVTPFGGYKFGGKINVSGNTTNPNVENLLIASKYDFGAIADYSIWPGFQAEFMWVVQPSTTISEQDFSTTPPTTTPLVNSTLSTYTWGADYTFRGDSKLRPFVAGGIGFTHFTNVDNSTVYLGFYNRLAYNIGGGVKYYFDPHIGFRFDFRYLATRTTPGIQCDQFGDCFRSNNHANQGETNFGLIIKF